MATSIIRKVSVYFTLIILSACGGSGGSSDTSRYGVFSDSPVSGLEYSSASYSGVTDQNGKFRYQPGETIQFFIGDIILGETEARGLITPMTLVNVSDSSNDTVVNIARFLQTLDDDDQPLVDGIVITAAIREAAVGQVINFAQLLADFETSSLSVVSALTTARSSGVRTLVPSADAITHLTQSMADLYSAAPGTYNGDLIDEKINCTDGLDHSDLIASGSLEVTAVTNNAGGASFTGNSAFTELNFDVINRYEMTFANISSDLLGKMSGVADFAVYQNNGLDPIDSAINLSVTGIWDGDSLIIRRTKSTNVGVTQSGDIRCDVGAMIRVSR